MRATLAILIAGCSSSSNAPTMSDPTCTPLQTIESIATTVSCTFNFDDSEGDIIGCDVDAPSGTMNVGFAPNMKTGRGTIQFKLTCNDLQAQTQVDLRLVDGAGNESDKQTVTFGCVAPAP